MEQSEKEIPSNNMRKLIFNDSLPAIWVDGFSIGIRSDKLITISALQASPTGNMQEQTRILMSYEHAKKLIEQLSKALEENK